MIDVGTLARAEFTEVRANGTVIRKTWHAEAHGVELVFTTPDLDSEYWVSPIKTMREKGVALIDSSGQMIVNERRDR